MRKIHFAIATLILAVCCLWLKNQGFSWSKAVATTSSGARKTGSESIGDPEVSGTVRTKVANREPAGPRATHAPERLGEFMLPEVAIDGLTLNDALQKLMGVYEQTCARTGEIPLRLTFELPPGTTKKLNLKLSPRNFNSSVQLLATYCGMKVSRSKTTYHFEPIPDERKQVSLAMKVPTDFVSRLIEQAGIPPLSCFEQFKNPSFVEASPIPLPLGVIFKMSGLDLDPSTRVSLGHSGSLELETISGTDAAVISALTETLAGDKPIQHKFTSQLVEIPPGSNWTPPDVSQMTDSQLQLLMREMPATAGTELTTLPSVTAKSGQEVSLVMTRELIVPTDESGTTFETHDIGKVVKITGSSLGFGHETSIHYTDLAVAPDEAAKTIAPITHTDLTDSGYTTDGGSRIAVQTRPDGSKTLLIVTSRLIDATGRPVHGDE